MRIRADVWFRLGIPESEPIPGILELVGIPRISREFRSIPESGGIPGIDATQDRTEL
jgi:hypothetical protein